MIKLLVKKQFTEIFRGYFVNAKTGTARSKASTILFVSLFAFLMVGVFGGTFTALGILMAPILTGLNMGWLYFALFGLISIASGAFGSVFSTYSGLYLAKDNDLLLSMPIPVRAIIVSRLLGVYLMGTMYSAMIFIPISVVYLVLNFSVSALLGSIVMLIGISLIVLVLSCSLGWCVAKASLKVKNRSFITTLVSLLFIVGAYSLQFTANTLINNFLSNALVYGTAIKEKAYIIFVFGSVGSGNALSIAVFSAVVAVLTALTYLLLSKSFTGIATATAKPKKAAKLGKIKQKSPVWALASKELSRFTSSANYMLNCGMGALFIPIAAIAFAVKGGEMVAAYTAVFGDASIIKVVLCAILMALVSMNDMATPALSLEGKSLWLPKSLPVSGRLVLLAKGLAQFVLTVIPAAFAVLCVCIFGSFGVVSAAVMLLLAASFSAFTALSNVFLGVKFANFTWSNELIPIKQSFGVAISMFGGWLVAGAFFGLYFLAQGLGFVWYALLATLLFSAISALIYRWICTKGEKEFERM